MKNILLPGLLMLLCTTGCKKTLIPSHAPDLGTIASADGFKNFAIKAGNHYCEGNVYKAVDVSEVSFTVRFDSTAIYQTSDPFNQDDINKLWGFADNNAQHHEYSARIGWRWSGGALRLFAYVYNKGKVDSREITTITLGAATNCRIVIERTRYIFTVNGARVEMPRQASTPKAKGYQLYPYFGGDEVAPHLINIWVKEG
jgi:hypothetical protein